MRLRMALSLWCKPARRTVCAVACARICVLDQVSALARIVHVGQPLQRLTADVGIHFLLDRQTCDRTDVGCAPATAPNKLAAA